MVIGNDCIFMFFLKMSWIYNKTYYRKIKYTVLPDDFPKEI
jgi:hypothetical protein